MTETTPELVQFVREGPLAMLAPNRPEKLTEDFHEAASAFAEKREPRPFKGR